MKQILIWLAAHGINFSSFAYLLNDIQDNPNNKWIIVLNFIIAMFLKNKPGNDKPK